MSTAGPPPSTMDDVVRFVIALLVQCGDADYPHVDGSGLTELLVGERYDGAEGRPRRVLFTPSPEGTASKLGPVLEIGARQIGSMTESCLCRVWGREATDDRDRYADAKLLCMRLFAAFNAAAVGRLELRRLVRDDQTHIVTFGEQYQMEIAYTWAVPRDGAIDAAALVLANAGALNQGPPDPDRPNGSTGAVYAVNVAMGDTR